METIQGEGGINPVSQEFFQLARDLTTKSGALLLVDEIQSGLGRTGKYFAYQHYGITPDIVTVAKPLAAGLPLGALLTTDRVATGMHPGMHGTTFGGGPLACAVAIEFLRQLDGLLGHVTKLGKYFLAQLQELQAKHSAVKAVRGMGLMLAIDIDSARHREGNRRSIIAAGNSDQSHPRHRPAFPAAVHHREEACRSSHPRARPCAQFARRCRKQEEV